VCTTNCASSTQGYSIVDIEFETVALSKYLEEGELAADSSVLAFPYPKLAGQDRTSPVITTSIW
jgi:hypothetical protein